MVGHFTVDASYTLGTGKLKNEMFFRVALEAGWLT
jgi:hypothetical protein